MAVAEELHFRRAAQRLHIAQPPLSQQIQKLELELGVELFRRSNRRVELTDAGRVFLEEAQRTLTNAGHAVDAVRSAARGEVGWLRLGFVGSVSYDLLPCLLWKFRKRYPGVQMELRQLTTEEQMSALEKGDIDLGIARELEPVNGLTIVPLLRERLLAALPAGHPLAGRQKIRLAELAEDSFITLPRPKVPRLYDNFVYLCRAAGFDPKIAQEALQFPTILGLVSAGLGVAIVPAVVQAFRKTGVAYVLLTDDAAVSDIAFAHRSSRESPVVSAFLDTAHEVARETDEDDDRPEHRNREVGDPRNTRGRGGDDSGRDTG